MNAHFVETDVGTGVSGADHEDALVKNGKSETKHELARKLTRC